MRATRRKFFGFMGGAAVAWPATAKSVAEPLVGSRAAEALMSVGAYGRAGGPIPTSGDEPTHKANRIATLVKRLSGFRSWSDRQAEMTENAEIVARVKQYEIDSLLSVSTRHRAEMIARMGKRLSNMRERYWWERELRSLRGEEE